MTVPVVSILLPVYNCEQYLHGAITSLLNQTFRNFELLIIDDCSNDDTVKVISSFADNRIVFIRNRATKGIVETLNKGLKRANGKYIAMMNASDICLPKRLEKQVNWLDQFPATDVAGCHVSFIDHNGKPVGDWKQDSYSSTYQQIKQKMPWESCLVHSSVMMRAGVVKQYLYQSDQEHTEGYDLWLRLLADGSRIEKVPEKLLLYRVHEGFISGNIIHKSNAPGALFKCKIKFLQERIFLGEWGVFETAVLFTSIHDAAAGITKAIKGMVEI